MLIVRFDELFGLLMAIQQPYGEDWMYATEIPEEAEKVVREFGKLWQGLMTKPDEELGIDSEFTRPAVEWKLNEFTRRCQTFEDRGDECVQLPFRWR